VLWYQARAQITAGGIKTVYKSWAHENRGPPGDGGSPESLGFCGFRCSAYLAFFFFSLRVARCSKQNAAVPKSAIIDRTTMPKVELSTMTSYGFWR